MLGFLDKRQTTHSLRRLLPKEGTVLDPSHTLQQISTVTVDQTISRPLLPKGASVGQEGSTEPEHVCNKCGRTFNLESHLKIHDELIHLQFACSWCDMTFPSNDLLQHHKWRLHNKHLPGGTHKPKKRNLNKNKCRMKLLRKDNESSLRMADQVELRESSTLSNPQSKNDARNESLQSKKPFRCNLCESAFTTKYFLRKHQKTHFDEITFKCDTCPCAFTSELKLKEHKNAHASEYKCNICPDAFASLHKLKQHRITHDENKPFQCDACPATFSDETALSRHKQKHTGERPFVCDICSSPFARKGDLRQHMRIHTEEKPFQCDLCPAAFNVKSNMLKHRRGHSKERPFVCEFCKASFTLKGNLTTHQLTHTNERAFQCDTCSSAFKTKAGLASHRKIHSGEKRYKCHECEKAFFDFKSLDRHRKSIHLGDKATSYKNGSAAKGTPSITEANLLVLPTNYIYVVPAYNLLSATENEGP